MRKTITTYQTANQRDGRVDFHWIVCPAGLIFVLFLSIVLGGCTRREQLVLESGAAGQYEEQQTAEAAAQAEDTASGEIVLQTGNAAAQMQAQTENMTAQAQTGTQDYQNAVGGGTQETGQPIVPEQEPENIYVHVCGAVEKPGVYELPAGSRVYEAVECAGGFTAEADANYVNQAQRLTDASKLVIPTVEQAKDAASVDTTADIGIIGQTQAEDTASGQPDGARETASNAVGADGAEADGKININTASEAQLCGIPGIGSTRAAAIVAYRQESGGFQKLEDIMNVSGIKEGTYNKIKDKIKVY